MFCRQSVAPSHIVNHKVTYTNYALNSFLRSLHYDIEASRRFVYRGVPRNAKFEIFIRLFIAGIIYARVIKRQITKFRSSCFAVGAQYVLGMLRRFGFGSDIPKLSAEFAPPASASVSSNLKRTPPAPASVSSNFKRRF